MHAIPRAAKDTAGRLHRPAVFVGLVLSALVLPVIAMVLLLGVSIWEQGLDGTRWSELLGFSLMFFVAAFVHALLIGLPAFLWLRRMGRLSAARLAVVGFVAGGLLIGLLGWPPRRAAGRSYSTYWHGQLVEMERDGVPTLYGWLSWLEPVALWGAVGVASALAFWYGWRYFQRQADARSLHGAGPRRHVLPQQ